MTVLMLLILNLFLLGVGLVVVLTKRSVIFIIIGIELLIQATISNYMVLNSQHASQLDGHVFAIVATAIAICEIVMVLAIFLRLYIRGVRVKNPDTTRVES